MEVSSGLQEPARDVDQSQRSPGKAEPQPAVSSRLGGARMGVPRDDGVTGATCDAALRPATEGHDASDNRTPRVSGPRVPGERLERGSGMDRRPSNGGRPPVLLSLPIGWERILRFQSQWKSLFCGALANAGYATDQISAEGLRYSSGGIG